jgi:hypothetical protein
MKIRVIFFLLFTGFFLSANVFAETFKGKVIDADTKQPIEGAAVVVSWNEERATLAGPTMRTKEVKETLTDKNGEWVITGPKGKDGGKISALLTFITGTYYTLPPEFIVFKPGYCPWSEGLLIDACKKNIKSYNFTNSNNIGQVVELPKLVNKEDRLRALPGTSDFSRAFDKKQLKFLKLVNEERQTIFGEDESDDYIKELEQELINAK